MRVEVESEVQGSVWKVEVSAGASVSAGDVLMILESMKMEIPVISTEDGKLAEILVKEEEPVSEGQVVAIVETS
jgi:acetyl-CoA carboxylase biotin carboxyl carrier protein